MFHHRQLIFAPLLVPLGAFSVLHGLEKRQTARCEMSRTCHIERRDGRTVVFRNKDEFFQKHAAFVKGGLGRLQVISDFDYTMTKFQVPSGKRGASCHCLIEDSGFLPPTFHTQAKALFHYYYPLEVSSTLSVQEKVPHMQDWVEKAHDLLLRSELRQSQIKFAVSEALGEQSLALRGGVTELLARLQAERVPLLLFSAGLGDVIEEVLRQECGAAQDVHIVSNHMVFRNDVLVGFSAPSYHVFNKKVLHAKDSSPYFQLPLRSHLLLLGDSLGDAAMCEGLDGVADEGKIKVGFLNDKAERLPDYLQAYDVVLLGDPDFHFVNTLLADVAAGGEERQKQKGESTDEKNKKK